MQKNMHIPLNFESYTDSFTGAQVTRLTPTDVICHRNYFYQKCFTNDGKSIVFGGEFAGQRNYYRLDRDEKTAVQLTGGSKENCFGGFLSPDDQHLYFVRGNKQLIRTALRGHEEEVIYTVNPDWVAYGTWVADSDCTKMVGILIHKDSWFELSDWKKFAEMYHAKPLCRLIRIDLKTGEVSTIMEKRGWLGHPQYRPFDDNTVAYCHEGPHDLVDARIWFINEDGTNIRCGHEHQKDESCTHEFWTPDGKQMVYVSFIKGQEHRWIRSIDPVTLQNTDLMVMPSCSHLMSNHDGSLIVGDGASIPSDVADTNGYRIDTNPYLYIFDVNQKTTKKIATHGSSWKVIDGDRQVTHPHPSFSPDESEVLFSSDMHGLPALYTVNLASLPETPASAS